MLFIKGGPYKLEVICEPQELNLLVLLQPSIFRIKNVIHLMKLRYLYHLFQLVYVTTCGKVILN